MVKPNTPYTTYIETQKGANEERETILDIYDICRRVKRMGTHNLILSVPL
jgi:hypothetical protein